MKQIFIIYLLLNSITGLAQDPISICSWNLKDFGKSKNDQEIEFIANTVKQFDIIAIQEVVSGYGGAQAVARLHAALNRMGTKWEYAVSEPTSSSVHKAEKYAYIWKTKKLNKVGDAWLEKKFNLQIDREPFYITFRLNDKYFTVANFHAITKTKQPEREIKYFQYIPTFNKTLNLIFAGDFNLPQSHTVFNPLRKMGYNSALKGVKTSLKKNCLASDCLSSEFDNFYFKASIFKSYKAGIIPFYTSFNSLKDARLISDHVPIYYQFSLN
ncbi:MAG: Endonuclease [Sphingobacteriales bacterium]|nr:Endonuclease [Sphingobacteriales bacterium]